MSCSKRCHFSSIVQVCLPSAHSIHLVIPKPSRLKVLELVVVGTQNVLVKVHQPGVLVQVRTEVSPSQVSIQIM